MRWEGVNVVDLALDMDRFQVLLNAVMNLQVL